MKGNKNNNKKKLRTLTNSLNFYRDHMKVWYRSLKSTYFNLRNLMSEEKSRLSFKLQEQVVRKPCLLWKNSRMASSKAGRLSWIAFLDGKQIKIYECHDEAQAIFIERVSSHTSLKQYFPACLMRKGKYLVVLNM